MPKFSGDGIKTVRVRVNDLHGGRAVAEATLDVDGSRPALTGLRALARVLGLPGRRTRAYRRAGSARAEPPRSTTVRFRLSEAATVTLAVNRARSGRRPKGKPCGVNAKRGRPLHRLVARTHDQAVPARGRQRHRRARPRPRWPLSPGAHGCRRGRQLLAEPGDRAAGRAAGALETSRWRDRGGAGAAAAAEARRIALAAQGFADGRPARLGGHALRRVLKQVGLLQIDSVNVLARGHYLTLFGRLGPYPLELVDKAPWYAPRRLFEYWGIEASLLPVSTSRSLRWRMQRAHDDAWGSMRRVAQERPDLVERAGRGGRAGADGGQRGGGGGLRRGEPWWSWSDTKRRSSSCSGRG